MVLSWQMYLGLSIACYSVSVILQKILLKNSDTEPVSFAVIFQTGVALVISCLVMLLHKQIQIHMIQGILWNLFVMTGVYALANICIFTSLQKTDASIFTIIFTSRTLFAILGASIFFGDMLDALQWTGALLIILGIIVVSVKKIKHTFNNGDLYALIAAFLFGIANINDKILVKYFDPYSYVIIGFLLPGLTIAIMNPHKMKHLRTYVRPDLLLRILLICLLYGVAATMFFEALRTTTNTSQLFAMNSFAGIFVVILSVFFLKEKDKILQKILGSVLSVIGLLLVTS